VLAGKTSPYPVVVDVVTALTQPQVHGCNVVTVVVSAMSYQYNESKYEGVSDVRVNQEDCSLHCRCGQAIQYQTHDITWIAKAIVQPSLNTCMVVIRGDMGINKSIEFDARYSGTNNMMRLRRPMAAV
jgi:hypothetical protein